MSALHDDELDVDVELVRRLVARSAPQYADLDIEPLARSGSTNAQFRLGQDLLVRLPRQPGGSATIAKEARWLPAVAAGLSIEVPEIVAVGEPAYGYPESWSVTRWIEGRHPEVPWPGGSMSGRTSAALAHDLARVVGELRETPVPHQALVDPALAWYRGGPLGVLDDDFRAWLRAAREMTDLDLDLGRAELVWEQALAAESAAASSPPVGWLHADLLAENMLVRDGRLVAVLDFGGLAVGDPTVDLIAAWEVLDAPGRAAFWTEVDADDVTRARARGWAMLICVMTFPYYWESMPERCASRRAMAAALFADRGRADHDPGGDESSSARRSDRA